MKKSCLILSAVLAILIAGASSAQELKKLSLDDASLAGTTVKSDTEVKTEGTASIRITTKWPTTICLDEVSELEIEEARLIYSAKVKTELDDTGNAFLEMWVQVNGGQFFSRGMDDIINSKSDWKAIRTPFNLQKGQKPEKVTLNLVINGKGTVWIDDISLSKEPLK